MPERVFSCRKCGQCCQGKGGIVLSEHDLDRLCGFLAMSEAEFMAEFTERSSGKIKIRNGANGFCVFFSPEQGCNVHAAKPDVCRAWPFFRGNLLDPHSLTLARDYCPGIRKDVPFSEFAEIGLAWLRQAGLASISGPANALRITENPEGASR